MPVIVLEARDFTSPLFLVRTWALLTGCLTLSLVASQETFKQDETQVHHLKTFRISCMFTWCLFFTLTLLIHVLSVIQFHSLIPISWKNLTMTVGALGSLMCLSASVVFPWFVMDHQKVSPSAVTATVASCLTFFAYTSEAFVIRSQAREQKGYMASAPGLLKILQFWGGCQMIPLVVEEACVFSALGSRELSNTHEWHLWVSGTSYILCLLMSLGSIVVILGDCAGQCPLPFDRLLAGFSLFGVLLYMVATVVCFTKVLEVQEFRHDFALQLVIMETVMAFITLLAYTMDLAFSIKLRCERGHV
ncbi:myeloid-associated differentiation marker homolog [Lampris incognitus]|uniref:myeloid-associated differentiation marker homolog n=1 Tax=Lampris incognitus TaxID=2546036 RepID=UPI0024B5F9E2|nr:myeloid-associated differentiation marker homolog [Lampris incognitus]